MAGPAQDRALHAVRALRPLVQCHRVLRPGDLGHRDGLRQVLPAADIGRQLFGWLTYALKTLHNFAGPLFAVSLVVVFFTFLRDNWPQRGDCDWLLKGGGMFGGEEVPSHRFNAGEKLVFWGGVLVLGGIVVASGLVLDKLIPGLAYDARRHAGRAHGPRGRRRC